MPVPAVLAPIVPQVILAVTPAGVVTSVAGGTTATITAQGSATPVAVYTDATGNGPTTTPSLDSKGQLLQTSGAPWFVVPGSYICTPNVAGGVPTGIVASVPLPTAAQVGAAPLLAAQPVQAAAYTAAAGQDVPVDTSAGGFTGTMPAATVGSRVRWTNVALTGTAVLTLATVGTDVFVLPANLLPVTAAPGESLDVRCLVTGRWSL